MTAAQQVFYEPYKTRWIVALDPGQTTDPSAIAVGEITPPRRAITLDDFDPDTGRRRPESRVPLNKGPVGRIDLRHLERLPLHTSYVAVVDFVRDLLRRPPLVGAELVIDQTGVGRPVVNMFTDAGLQPLAVTITGGNTSTTPRTNEFHVPKLELVSRAQSVLHRGELHIAPTLIEAKTLAHELSEFRGTFSESTGYVSWGARSGAHDDLVLATCLVCWAAFRVAPQWGTSEFKR